MEHVIYGAPDNCCVLVAVVVGGACFCRSRCAHDHRQFYESIYMSNRHICLLNVAAHRNTRPHKEKLVDVQNTFKFRRHPNTDNEKRRNQEVVNYSTALTEYSLPFYGILNRVSLTEPLVSVLLAEWSGRTEYVLIPHIQKRVYV